MKHLQEYSNEANHLIPSVSNAIKRIEKLPLPYTGNKKKLASRIHDAIIEHKIEFNSVLDAFSGSGTMSYLFKLMGKKVLSNDLLTSSFLNSVAFVENPGIKLTEEEQEFLLHNQNKNKNTFVEDNYLSIKERPTNKICRFNKFTLKECQHLDNFRANIDELLGGIHAQSLGFAANAAIVLRLPFGNLDQSIDIMMHRNRQNEEYGKNSNSHDRRIGIYYDKELNLNFEKWFTKYVADFIAGTDNVIESKIKKAAFLANLQQHVLRDCMVQGRMHRGQAFAEIDVRLNHQKNQLKGHWSNNGSTEMDFFTRAGTGSSEGKPGQGMKFWNVNNNPKGTCLAVNMDIITLLKNGLCDGIECVYFDPPYGSNSSDYATIYRFLEEYIYSQPLEELPHIYFNSKKFVNKKNYEQNFVEMLEAANKIPIWMFSYNDNSWKSIEYISDIVRQFRKNVEIIILDEKYRYLLRKNQSRGEDQKSCEYLIVAR